jgi:hypothetical protein
MKKQEKVAARKSDDDTPTLAAAFTEDIAEKASKAAAEVAKQAIADKEAADKKAKRSAAAKKAAETRKANKAKQQENK